MKLCLLRIGPLYIASILFKVYFLVLLLDPSFLPLTLSLYSHYSTAPHSTTIPSHMILSVFHMTFVPLDMLLHSESDLQSRLVVYNNLLYFTYAPQFVYQLSLPSSHSKFPFMISISSHYLLNLCHSEIKDTTSARAWHISLHQVLTKSPSLLSSVEPLVQFVLTFLLSSRPLSDLSLEDPDLTSRGNTSHKSMKAMKMNER